MKYAGDIFLGVFGGFVIWIAAMAICLCVTSFAWSDEIETDGVIETAECNQVAKGPIEIICVSKTQRCTFWPETNEIECIQF